MELRLEIKYDELKDDHTRASDEVIRDLSRRFPEAIWEKYKQGWKLLV